MYQVTGIAKSFGARTVLADVTCTLGAGQKVALVGPNGSGKSTLLGILAGTIEAESGTFSSPPETRIGYFPQQLSAVGNGTILDYLRSVSGVADAEAALQAATDGLGSGTVSLEAFGHAQDTLERLGGYTLEQRAEAILDGLGAGALALDRSLRTLSGGQKSTVALAGILLRGIDLLLLDEPTNNLDLPALLWLEAFIHASGAACIIVSHDRRFLDRVVTKVFALDRDTHTLTEYAGTFTDYEGRLAKERVRHLQLFTTQQRELQRLRSRLVDLKAAGLRSASGGAARDNDKSARNFKAERSGSKLARRAKNIERRIEQMPKVEKPFDRTALHLAFGNDVPEGDLALAVRDLTFTRGDFTLAPVSFDLEAGSRTAILGAVGSGKSTLLQLLAGALTPAHGTVETRGTIGWYDQEHTRLPAKATGVGAFMELTGIEQSFSYRYLKSLGIEEAEFLKPVASFSPGGRARIMLAVLMAQQPDILLLDEPTNHLDLEALAALEEALRLYVGTLLLVTHDRSFLEHVAPTRLLAIEDGHLDEVANVDAYEARVLRARGAIRIPHVGS